MSVKLNILRKLVRELIKRELEEATMTGNIDGGAGPPKTPKAFKKKKKGQKEEEARGWMTHPPLGVAVLRRELLGTSHPGGVLELQ